jgi:hypothetical protein
MDFAVDSISSRSMRPHNLPWVMWPFNGLSYWVGGLGGVALGFGSRDWVETFREPMPNMPTYISHGEDSEASLLPFDKVSSKSVLHSFHWFAYRVPVAICRVDASHPHNLDLTPTDIISPSHHPTLWLIIPISYPSFLEHELTQKLLRPS